MKILLTGAAGFICAATARQFLDRGDTVVGLGNLTTITPGLETQTARIAPPACQLSDCQIGSCRPHRHGMLDFISCLKSALGMTVEKELLPMQDGDVPATYADTFALNE